MGYNTVILVQNDALGQIETDLEFGKNLAAAIREFSAVSSMPPGSHKHVNVKAGNHMNAAAVYSVEHADWTVLLTAGGNHATVLHRHYNGGRHYKLEDQWDLVETAYQTMTESRPSQESSALQSVQKLMEEDSWADHPVHKRAEWQAEAAEGNTQRGYWDWVQHHVEIDEACGDNDSIGGC